MDQDDFYATLGVSRTAEPWVIQLKYRTLMRRYHPDVGSEPDTGRVQRINQAYEVLGDPEKRLRYDASLGVPAPAPDAPRKGKAKPRRGSPEVVSFAAEPSRPSTPADRAILWWFMAFYVAFAALLILRR